MHCWDKRTTNHPQKPIFILFKKRYCCFWLDFYLEQTCNCQTAVCSTSQCFILLVLVFIRIRDLHWCRFPISDLGFWPNFSSGRYECLHKVLHTIKKYRAFSVFSRARHSPILVLSGRQGIVNLNRRRATQSQTCNKISNRRIKNSIQAQPEFVG